MRCVSSVATREAAAAGSLRIHGAKPLPATIAHAIEDARGANRAGFTFLNARLEPRTLTWDDVALGANARALWLRQFGVGAGERLGLIAEDNQEFVLWFLAAVLAGVVVAPIQTPLPTSDRAAYVDHVARMLNTVEAQWLICPSRLSDVGAAVSARVKTLRVLPAAEAASASAPEECLAVSCRPEHTCFVQFTSGSTSDPRAVEVTHRNLIENIDAAQRRTGADVSRDVGVSWLPLYHDFGLIGTVLTPLVSLGRSIIMPTLAFATRPRVWLETVHAYRATMTGATNFALRVAARRMPRVSGLDLSSLRVLTIGAEPIQVEVVEAFVAAFAPFGLRDGVVSPCYGLAESTLAVTVPEPGTPLTSKLVPDHEERAAGEPLRAVGCGTPIPGHELRIAAADGREVPAGQVGEIQVRGPSVTPGYFGNEGATAELFGPGGWLKTGDLGFMHESELYVCGRLKDLIIVQGRNYHPQQIEWEVGQIDGVRADSAVAFSVPGDGTESLVVVVEAQHPERTQGLAGAVRARVAARIGLNARDVVLIHPWTLPKTSSGKLQRRKTRELYLAGSLAQLHGPPSTETE